VEAAPTTIDRRITGVTVTARSMGVEAPKAARAALKLDPQRQARGRRGVSRGRCASSGSRVPDGQAVAVT
jgi:hypothetical protein